MKCFAYYQRNNIHHLISLEFKVKKKITVDELYLSNINFTIFEKKLGKLKRFKSYLFCNDDKHADRLSVEDGHQLVQQFPQ